MAKELTQMELYCEIGKAVCQKSEKGAAVMASEYLNRHYPDVKGFSPRSLRRMRDFYRTYENHSALLRRAMKLGWIQNVVIMEAELTMELREWYMKAAKQFEWSKTELIANIAENAHETIVLAVEGEQSSYFAQRSVRNNAKESITLLSGWLHYLFLKCWNVRSKKHKRRRHEFFRTAQIIITSIKGLAFEQSTYYP